MLEDTRQARKWLKDVDANLAAPMARVRRGDTNRDYYVHELALVQPHSEECARPVMIKRWYEKEGELVADVHPMRLTPERAPSATLTLWMRTRIGLQQCRSMLSCYQLKS